MKKQDYEPLWTLKKDTQTHSVWSREEGQLGLGGRAHGGLEWAFAGAHQWRRFLHICCRPFPAAFLENSHRAQIWSPQPKFWERFFIIVAGMSFCWCSSMATISLHLLRAFSCCFSGKIHTVRNPIWSPQPKFWDFFNLYCCWVLWLRKVVTVFSLIFLRVFTCGTYWGQVTNSVTPFSLVQSLGICPIFSSVL